MRRVLLKLVFLLSGISSLALHAQPGDSGERYIARAGKVFITEQEFLQRFELLPALYRHRKSQLQGAKLELLYSMIAEKLLAQEALQRSLDQDSLFQSAFLSLRKLLARDQLYRDEVSRKVTITPGEIVREIGNARRLVRVSFMYFDRREDADFVRNLIRTSIDFDRLKLDSTMLALRDTATVIWGEAEMAIEEAAFALKPGDISPIVEAGTGYYILRCMEKTPSTHLSDLSADVLKERVLKRIRQRKEDVLMHKFIPTVLKNVRGYSRPGPFKQLALTLADVFEAKFAVHADTSLSVTREVVEEVRARLGAAIHDSLVIAGSVSWSIGDVLDRLLSADFSVSRGKTNGIPAKLNGDLEYWVQQELIAQEALRRGLDQHPEIRYKVQMWRDAYLADMMKLYTRNHVSVSEGEVWQYLKLLDTAVTVPRVKLRELRTSSLDDMNSALADLEGGMSFEDVVRKWSTIPDARMNGGVTRLFAVTDRPPVGEIAAEMKIGERFGPLRVGEDILFFEVIERETVQAIAGVPAAEKLPQATEEFRARKQQGMLNQFLSQVARDRGVDVYTDRLVKLDVTPIPMLTFRFLGFGGRMFEVPFVDPQLQWLNTDPPDGPVLP